MTTIIVLCCYYYLNSILAKWEYETTLTEVYWEYFPFDVRHTSDLNKGVKGTYGCKDPLNTLTY